MLKPRATLTFFAACWALAVMLDLISAFQSHIECWTSCQRFNLTQDAKSHGRCRTPNTILQFFGQEGGHWFRGRVLTHFASPSTARSKTSSSWVWAILLPASIFPFLSAARPLTIGSIVGSCAEIRGKLFLENDATLFWLQRDVLSVSFLGLCALDWDKKPQNMYIYVWNCSDFHHLVFAATLRVPII